MRSREARHAGNIIVANGMCFSVFLRDRIEQWREDRRKMDRINFQFSGACILAELSFYYTCKQSCMSSCCGFFWLSYSYSSPFRRRSRFLSLIRSRGDSSELRRGHRHTYIFLRLGYWKIVRMSRLELSRGHVMVSLNGFRITVCDSHSGRSYIKDA